MDLCARVASFIQDHGLLTPGQKLVVGVSGGADSLCLMDCLHRLGYEVIVAHLDHQLRPRSAEDAAYVASLAERHGLPRVVGTQDVIASSTKGLSPEEAARLARYRFLARVAHEWSCTTIATGHTSDDQAETILMHLLRGAGSSGIVGMKPESSLGSVMGESAGSLRLIRPLLTTSHLETVAHCRAAGFQPCVDESNLDRRYLRNRIRHELLPLLESYNPQFRKALLTMARILADEAEVVERAVEEAWPRVARESGGEAVFLRRRALLGEPIAVRRACVRRAMAVLAPDPRGPTFAAVDRLLTWMSASPRGILSLEGNLEAFVAGGQCVLCRKGADAVLPSYPQLMSSNPQELGVPGTLQLASGWILEASETPAAQDLAVRLAAEGNRRVAAFDPDRIAGPLQARPPLVADRFRPSGMRGSISVRDLLVNAHVARQARARWPVVTVGQRIVWVAGLRRSQEALLGQDSRRAVVLRLIPGEDGDEAAIQPMD